MANILFLAHRIPFPPNKGDKIRSFHILKHLTTKHRVFLGAFIDDENDWQYTEEMQSICSDSFFCRLNPRIAKLCSLRGLLSGQALTEPYYANSQMAKWVNTVLTEQAIDTIFVFSSAMGQYLPEATQAQIIIDFVDVDSDKWRQYSASKSWPMNAVYAREAKCLLHFEQHLAARSSASLFVSPDEARLFKQLAPDSRDKITHLNNGVDLDYFSPNRTYETPFGEAGLPLVFTGAMDYWANIEAVQWFAKQVFPIIHAALPSCCFYIVGSKPTKAVTDLSSLAGVFVTGRVEDVRPYLHYAALSLAPLRIARGIQNKVLEALSMAKPVVATQMAMEGITASGQLDLDVCDDAEAMAERIVQRLKDPAFKPLAVQNRKFVENEYSWNKQLQTLDALISSR